MSAAHAVSTQRRGLFGASGLIVFLVLWEGSVRSGLTPSVLLPAPSQIPLTFMKEIVSGQWLSAVSSSLSHYLLGLLIGASFGVVLGVITGLSTQTEAALAWVVRLLRPIPGLAWVPFAIIWFGVSTASAIFIIAIGVFWIAYFATMGAVATIDRDYYELARAFGYKSTASQLFTIILPAAAPGILAGLRTSLGQAWMAVVAAELFGVAGVGQRMMQAASLLSTDIVVVYMATMAGLYGVFDVIFIMLQDRALQWKA